MKNSYEDIRKICIDERTSVNINFVSWKLREIWDLEKNKTALSLTKRKIFTHVVFTDNIFEFRKAMMAMITMIDWSTLIERNCVPSSTRCFVWIISFNS